MFYIEREHQNFVKPIVEQFNAGEEVTVQMITDKMGDATIDFTAEALGLKSGAIVWVKDCKTYDEVKAKWEAEEPVEALVVTLLANNVVSVTYVIKLLLFPPMQKGHLHQF